MPQEIASSKIPVLAPGVEIADPSQEQPAADEAARRLYEDTSPAVVQILTNKARGTGFFFNEEGSIITAAHVVQGSNEHWALTKDGTRYKLVIEKMDDINDIAVMRPVGLPKGSRPFLQLAADSKLKLDQPLYAVGHPHGLRPAYLSPGNYKATSTTLDLVAKISPRALKNLSTAIKDWTPNELNDVDASLKRPLLRSHLHILHGNSGGPLIDEQYRAVGISDMINPRFPTESYYVPVEKIHDLLKPGNGKFTFTYERQPEQWARHYTSHWSNMPSLAVAETGIAGIAGYGAYRALSRQPIIAGAAAGTFGVSMFASDFSSLLQSTDSADKWKYALATASDAVTTAGAVATFFPKTRPIGMAAIGLGVIGRAGTDFLKTRLVLSDYNRKNGEPRGPFDAPI
jgi:hypothetical protein